MYTRHRRNHFFCIACNVAKEDQAQEGQAFPFCSSGFEKAQPALELLENARAADSGQEDNSQLRLVIHVNRRIVMQAIERFQRDHPTVSILLTHDLSAVQEADPVITAHSMEFQGVTQEKLFRENILLSSRAGLLPHRMLRADDVQDKAPKKHL